MMNSHVFDLSLTGDVWLASSAFARTSSAVSTEQKTTVTAQNSAASDTQTFR